MGEEGRKIEKERPVRRGGGKEDRNTRQGKL